MKTKTLKQILATTVLATSLLLTNAGISNSGWQANQNTQNTKSAKPTDWISYIRQMEQAGGAMGLSETQKTDLTSSNGSNGIDVHMMKTTEYGAIAILSASGYGNPSNDREITTTTGNSTGMILNTTSGWECTAGGVRNSIFSGINVRYYDAYSDSSTSAKIGDALGTASTPNPGCSGWHSAGVNSWTTTTKPYIARRYLGIFAYSWNDNSGCYSRGVAICGTGF